MQALESMTDCPIGDIGISYSVLEDLVALGLCSRRLDAKSGETFAITDAGRSALYKGA